MLTCFLIKGVPISYAFVYFSSVSDRGAITLTCSPHVIWISAHSLGWFLEVFSKICQACLSIFCKQPLSVPCPSFKIHKFHIIDVDIFKDQLLCFVSPYYCGLWTKWRCKLWNHLLLAIIGLFLYQSGRANAELPSKVGS